MSKFRPIGQFKAAPDGSYNLLPFRFTELNHAQFVLSNLAGEYLVANRDDIPDLINHRLSPEHPLYIELRARHFLIDEKSSIAPELLAIKLRTRYARLAEFTGLHIFVVSLRCEHSCPYCQVSRQSEDKVRYDMSPSIASKAVDLALRSPSQNIKIEFQGGEPLLNFGLVRDIVNEAKSKNEQVRKNLNFVIATNLALVTRDMLLFCREHSVSISTSLDGPRDLHNANRPRQEKNSYEKTLAGVSLAREILGRDQVSALMTTTKSSLSRVTDIIDEYRVQGFSGIFLRPLSPYGFAVKTKTYEAYHASQWFEFYKQGLEYIIELNRAGVEFSEYYAGLVLKKMLTSDDPGYVDLMSPAGIGIGAVVYNYDGYVYASDEARMLAEMGDHKFRIGHVLTDDYKSLFTSQNLLEPLEESFAFSSPMCNDCAFEPYCGSDPVFHYGKFGDYLGKKPQSEFCLRSMSIFRLLISKMEADRYVRKLFTSWANR